MNETIIVILIICMLAIAGSPLWEYAYHMITEWFAVQTNSKLRKLQSRKEKRADD